MNVLTLAKVLGGALVLSCVTLSNAAAGNGDKLANAACYASIQKKCHGTSKCTPEAYAEGIAWCDVNFTDVSSQGTSTKVLSATKLMLNFLTPN